ncbi:MAG TPA: choice-of-anchor Q domain-containing protein, partial [Rudaea sp.]|nr:choice-of-anchor Q domain-containing protein [Rudaea sp.]
RFSPYALIKFDRLTLRNGRSLSLNSGDFKQAPFLGQSDYSGHITLVKTHITGFTGGGDDEGAGVSFILHNGNFTMIDVLFDHVGGSGSCAIAILPWDDDYTRLDHVTMALSGNRNLCLDDSTASSDKVYEVDNTIVWPTDGGTSTIRGLTSGDPNVDSNIDITLNNSLLKGYAGVAKSISNNHPVSADPLWVDPAGNYRLKTVPKSPAINAGSTQVPGGEPATDLDGNTRVVGSAPDIGAYESPANDADTFTVTNVNDSGAGSLRAAMTQANASSAAVTAILFDIRSGGSSVCPAVINLASPLPDIMVPMQIEGGSQGGSQYNSDPAAFNAQICVVVQPGATFGIGNAFRVPAASNASLTLVGVGVGSFYRGVSLQGGNGHRILGNQFGGWINGGTYQLGGANGLPGSSSAAIYVNTPATPASVQIGGDEPSYRNSIQYAVSQGIAASAIFIGPLVHGAGTSCQIVGNTLGVTDDGMDTAGNDYGLMLEGTYCNASGNRFAGNSKDAIWINGGNNNVVQNNSIGVLAYGFNLASINHGVGVRVEGNDNVIGGSVFDGAPIAHENTIENMDGPGIVVVGGAGNTLRANTLVYNNAAVASDLEIDLGYDGPTVNDSSDADAGANLQQNFPTLHGLTWAVPPKAGDTNVSATIAGTLRTLPGPGFYQVDAYSSDSCDPITGRGTGQSYVGGISYVYVPVGSNVAAFSVPVILPFYNPKGGTVSVTATSNSNGDYSTSELGKCFNTDTIYRDGVEAE